MKSVTSLLLGAGLCLSAATPVTPSSIAFAQDSSESWSETSRLFPGSFSITLDEVEHKLLSDAQLFPPAHIDEFSDFNEALFVRPIRVREAQLENFGEITFERETFLQAVKALKEVERYRSKPAVKAYEDQYQVVLYFERKLSEGVTEDEVRLTGQLSEARDLLERFRQNLSTEAPDLVQQAILKRLYRTLASTGFAVPELSVFQKEWAAYTVAFLNQDMLTIRMPLVTDLSPTELDILGRISKRYRDFGFRIGTVQNLELQMLNNDDAQKMISRATIELREEGGFNLVVRMNFAAAMAAFQEKEQLRYLPLSVSGSVVSANRLLKLPSYPSLFCLKTQVAQGAMQAAPCEELSHD